MTNQLGKNGQQSCANKNTGVGLGRLLTTESGRKNESDHRPMCTVWDTAHVHNNTKLSCIIGGPPKGSQSFETDYENNIIFDK